MSKMDDLSEANRKHWDTRAHDYDAKPWQKKMIGYIHEQLVDKRKFFGLPEEKGGEFRLLDYASGPGTVSAALSLYTTSVLAIDLSKNMIAEYQSRFPSPSCTAIVGNLLATPPSISSPSSPETKIDAEAIDRDPLLNDFDAVIVGLGFHHFENWALAMLKLSERVKKGGVVGIVDLEPDLDHYNSLTPEMRAMMHKSGFTKSEMQEYMAEAGLVDIEFLPLEKRVVMQMKGKDVKRGLFFARGRRA